MNENKLLKLDNPLKNAEKKFIVKNSIATLKSDKSKEKEAELAMMIKGLHNETGNTSMPLKLPKSIKNDREQKDQVLSIYNGLPTNLDKLYNKLHNTGYYIEFLILIKVFTRLS